MALIRYKIFWEKIMIKQSDWIIIKEEFNKVIKPIFDKASINFPLPFDEILELFKFTLETKIGEEDLDARNKIIEVLKIRFIEKNMNKFPIVLSELSLKCESFLKRIFKITNQKLIDGGNGMYAHYLKSFIKIFKALNDEEFSNFDNTYLSEFFDSKKPNYNNPIFFKGAHALGDHLKWCYNIRNAEGHSDPDIEEIIIINNINSFLVVYLYIILKFHNRIKRELIHTPATDSISNWNIFRTHCNNFEKGQLYFLVIDKIEYTNDKVKYFSNINWSIIIDSDVDTEEDGLYNKIKDSYPKAIQPIIHSLDDRNKIPTLPPNTTFWYHSKGVKGSSKSLPKDATYANWKKMYLRYTEDLINKMFLAISPRTINVIILSKDKNYLSDILYAINTLNITINFIFASEDNSELSDLVSSYNGKKINIPIEQMVEGFRGLAGSMLPPIDFDSIYLPCHSSKGRSVQIPKSDYDHINQYFTIVHLNIAQEEVDTTKKTFYQGRTISWYELDNDYDVKRDITDDAVRKLNMWLNKRSDSGLFYLNHEPGAGGTTIARRIAFIISKQFPVLFLNETIESFDETKTVENLVRVTQLTDLPLFVVIDNTTIKDAQIHLLKQQAESRLAKTIFLVTRSSFDVSNKNNNFFLPLKLDFNSSEPNRFYEKFAQMFPDKRTQFERIIDKHDKEFNENYITPFYFGLIANEEKFITIPKFVKQRLKGLTKKQSDLITFVAFCMIFAKSKHREVPSYYLSSLLQVSDDFMILHRHVSNKKIFDLIIETEPLHWRALHQLIAKEILAQTFTTNQHEMLNPSAIKEHAIKTIKISKDIAFNNNQEVLGLLSSLFIERSYDTFYGSSNDFDNNSSDIYNKNVFAELITELKYNESRIEVFQELVNLFPEEDPHFWGHLARLYSYNKDHTKAIEAINNAIKLNPTDFKLLHIKGMCFRSEFYKIRDAKSGNENISEVEKKDMKYYFNEAEKTFDEVIEKAPQKEHGYVAFVQMAIQMIEFGLSLSNIHKKQNDNAAFFRTEQATFYRDILTKATEKITDFKKSHYYLNISPKITTLETKLLKYYGDKDKIVNTWNTLLDNPHFDKQLVSRQLVYAYLAKYNNDWDQLKIKDLNRINDLISTNLSNNSHARDLQLWFEAARRLNKTSAELIKKLQEWEFQKELPETAYYLFSLYCIQILEGSLSATDEFNKYLKICKERKKDYYYNRVFCPEWIGIYENKPFLINHINAGKWNKSNSFFEDKSPKNLFKLKGKISKYIDRNKGYIEIDNCGIEAFYQPGKVNHYSTDAQKTRVEFYVGLNYDGARAFQVSNIEK